jgi:hypothetical protein
VRERGEEQVGFGQGVRVGAGEDGVVKAGVPGELRVRGGDRLPGAAVGGERADLEVGMTGQQPEQFAARVAAGPRYRNPGTHMSLTSSCNGRVFTITHEYAQCRRRPGRPRGALG